MSIIDFSNPFYYILNSNLNCKPQYLIRTIKELCLPSNNLQDLFILKFCTALIEGLITLTNYKINSHENLISDETLHCSKLNLLKVDFVDYDHPSNSTLKTILDRLEPSQSMEYSRYCNYLNRLVCYIVIYHDKVTDSFKTILSIPHQEQLRDLYNKCSIQQYINAIPTIEPNNTCTFEEMVEYLSKSPLLKINIPLYHFTHVISQNNIKLLELFIDYATDINVEGIYNNLPATPLVVASEHDYLECLMLLIQNENTLLQPFERDRKFSPLITATKKGDMAKVQLFIDLEAELNSYDVSCYNAVITATKINRVDILVKLLNSGANVNMNSLTLGGRSVLNYAAFQGNSYIMTTLLEYGASAYIVKDPKSGNIPELILATQGAHLDCMGLLLDYFGTSIVDLLDKGRRTALIWAAKKGNDHCIHFLLEKGKANPKLRDIYGISAKEYAINTNIEHCIVLLNKY